VEQLSLLFNEAKELDAKSCVEEQADAKIKEHARRHRSGSIEDVVPEGLPEDQRQYPVCGGEMVEIGRKVHRPLKIKYPEFSIQEDVYYNMPVSLVKRKAVRR